MNYNPMAPDLLSVDLPDTTKIGFYRQPTHRRDAYKKILSMIPSHFKSKYWSNV